MYNVVRGTSHCLSLVWVSVWGFQNENTTETLGLFCGCLWFFLFSPPTSDVVFFWQNLTKLKCFLKMQNLYPFSAKLNLQGGNNEAVNTGHYTWPQSVLLTLLLDFTTEHLDVVSFLLFSITLFILRGLFRSQLANCDHCCALWSNQAASDSRTDRH